MTLAMEYRLVRPDLHIRTTRTGDPTGRTVYGIAVPWNAPTRINDRLTEMFVRGAFDHQLQRPGRVKFAREHLPLGGVLIGAATLLRNDASGLYTEYRVAKTKDGDDVLALVEAEALDELSVGFMPDPRGNRTRNGVTERFRADLREVAITMEGAYGRLAVAAGVRSAQGGQSTMEPDDIPEMVMPEGTEEMRAAQDAAMRIVLPDLPDLDAQLAAIRAGLTLG